MISTIQPIITVTPTPKSGGNDTEFLDPRLDRYILGDAHRERIAEGTEGPVWFSDAGCLLFSDIPEQPLPTLD